MIKKETQKRLAGARLRLARKIKKMPTKELAAKADVSQSTLSNQERGVRGISGFLAGKYEQILGLRPGVLLAVEEDILGVPYDVGDLAAAVAVFMADLEESEELLRDPELRREVAKNVFNGGKQLLNSTAVEKIEDAVLQAGGIVLRTKKLLGLAKPS